MTDAVYIFFSPSISAAAGKPGYPKGQGDRVTSQWSENMEGVVERVGSVFGARRKRTYPTSSSGGGGAESAMDYMHKGAAVKTKKNHYQVGDTLHWYLPNQDFHVKEISLFKASISDTFVYSFLSKLLKEC